MRNGALAVNDLEKGGVRVIRGDTPPRTPPFWMYRDVFRCAEKSF